MRKSIFKKRLLSLALIAVIMSSSVSMPGGIQAKEDDTITEAIHVHDSSCGCPEAVEASEQDLDHSAPAGSEQPTALSAEASTGDKAMIAAFSADQGIALSQSYWAGDESRPMTQAQLGLPDSLAATLTGEDQSFSLPVNWVCTNGTNGNETIYAGGLGSYVFSPVWDEDVYALAEGISAMTVSVTITRFPDGGNGARAVPVLQSVVWGEKLIFTYNTTLLASEPPLCNGIIVHDSSGTRINFYANATISGTQAIYSERPATYGETYTLLYEPQVTSSNNVDTNYGGDCNRAITNTTPQPAITVTASGFDNLTASTPFTGGTLTFTMTTGYAKFNRATVSNNADSFSPTNIPAGLSLSYNSASSTDTAVVFDVAGTPATAVSEAEAQTLTFNSLAIDNFSYTKIAISPTSTVKLAVAEPPLTITGSFDLTGNYTAGWSNITLDNAAVSGLGLSEATGQSIEYAISTSATTAPDTGYGSSLSFSSLTAGTTYYIWARAAADGSNSASPAIASGGIMTLQMPTVAATATGFTGLKNGAAIAAGSEPKITYTATNGTFTTSINASAFTVTGLTGTGLSAATPVRSADGTKVEITITGTPIKAVTSQTLTFASSIPAVNFNDSTAADGAITVTGSGSFSIAKGDGAATLNGSITASNDNISYDSITITGVTTSNGQSVEYLISTAEYDLNDQADVSTLNGLSGWQTDLTFSSLSSDTTYYVYARPKGNNDYNSGLPLGSASIKTKAEADPSVSQTGTMNLLTTDSPKTFEVSLGYGSNAAATATIESSDPSVITVSPASLSADGNITVTVAGAGSATITIKFDGAEPGIQIPVSVTIPKPPAGGSSSGGSSSSSSGSNDSSDDNSAPEWLNQSLTNKKTEEPTTVLVTESGAVLPILTVNSKPENNQDDAATEETDNSNTGDDTTGNIQVSVNTPQAGVPEVKLANQQILADAVLTAEEKQMLKNQDISVSIIVEITPVKTSAKTEAAVTESLSAGEQVAMYMDISILKNIVENASDTILTNEKVHMLNDAIRLTLDIPKEFRDDSRAFFILRIHNGEVAILNDLDDAPDTITIETDRFSDYVLAYRAADLPAADNTDTIPASETPAVKQAAGNSNAVLWIALLTTIFILGIVMIIIINRRRKM